jgi:beta-phosphoglucomutase family hydrolase
MVTINLERYEALIFDLDGVITQTASLHAQAWKRLFDEFLTEHAAKTRTAFVPFDPETDYRLYVDGKPRIVGVQSFLGARGIDLPIGTSNDDADQKTAHALASRKDQFFEGLLARKGVQVFASAVRFLHDARRCNVRTAVASSSHHCAEILRAADLTTLFDVRVDGVDVDRLGLSGKPAPDMFLEVARRLAVAPSRAVVFEDATAGIAAARAGGFGLVIGVGRSTQATALVASGADQVVADLSEVSLQGQDRRRRCEA